MLAAFALTVTISSGLFSSKITAAVISFAMFAIGTLLVGIFLKRTV